MEETIYTKHTTETSSQGDLVIKEIIDLIEETKGREVIFTWIEIQITGMIDGVEGKTTEAEDTERERERAIMRITLMVREVKEEEKGEMDISMYQK